MITRLDRMASAKGVRTTSMKEKKNTQKLVSDLVVQNEQLMEELTTTKTELTETKQKLSKVLVKVMDCADRK